MAANVDPVQETIENWRRKCSQVALRSTDVIVPMISKTFETMSTVMRPNSDPILTERTLASLASERDLSIQYDNMRDDPVRDLTYDLVDSVHLILGQLYTTRNQYAMHGYGTNTQLADQTMSDGTLTPISRGRPVLIDVDENDSFYGNDMHGLFQQEGMKGEIKNENESDGKVSPVDVKVVRQTGGTSAEDKKKVIKIKSEGGAAKSTDSAAEMKCLLCDEYTTFSVIGYIYHLKHKHNTSALEAGIVFGCECGHESHGSTHVQKNPCRPGALMTAYRGETAERAKKMREVATKMKHKKAREEGKANGEEDGEKEEEEEVRSERKKAAIEEVNTMEEEERVISQPINAAKLKKKNKKKMVMTESDEEDMRQSKRAKIEKESNGKKVEDNLKTGEGNIMNHLRCIFCEYSCRRVANYVVHLGKKHGMTPKESGISFLCECGHVSRSNGHDYSGKCPNAAVQIIVDDVEDEEIEEREGEEKEKEMDEEGEEEEREDEDEMYDEEKEEYSSLGEPSEMGEEKEEEEEEEDDDATDYSSERSEFFDDEDPEE